MTQPSSQTRETTSGGLGTPMFVAAALGLLLVLFLRLGMNGFPAPVADEGGWPFSVRLWVTQGFRTPDYYVAPGYHWLLAIPFKLFGPTLQVARLTSSVVGLVWLALFYAIARRSGFDRTAAFWAVMVLGTSYQGVNLDRRALMEPLQIFGMLALVWFYLRPATTGNLIAIALCTAGLLLTKMSAIFLPPALVVASLWEQPGEPSAARRNRWIALAVGVALACAVFGGLYLSDPVTFASGWFPTLTLDVVERSRFFIGIGRFGLDPVTAFNTLQQMTYDEPLLFAFGLAGMLKALIGRRQTTMAFWLLAGATFLFLQALVLDNHLVVLLPATAFLTVWLLSELKSGTATIGVGRLRFGWPGLCLLGQVLYGTVRLLGVKATTSDPAGEAVAWLQAHSKKTDVVAAAPMILMQLEAQPVAFFKFQPPYLPAPDKIHGTPAVTWILFDQQEWGGYVRKSGVSPAEAADVFSACCDSVFVTPGATVFKVRD